MTGQASHPVNMPGLKRLFAVPPGTPGACEYSENGTSHAVLVPDGTTLVFVLIPRHLESFAVPQAYVSRSGGGGLACSHRPESYIKEKIKQMKVAPVLFDT